MTNTTLQTLEKQVLPRLEQMLSHLAQAHDEVLSEQIEVIAKEAAELLDLLRRFDPSAAAVVENNIDRMYRRYKVDLSLLGLGKYHGIVPDEEYFAMELRNNLQMGRQSQTSIKSGQSEIATDRPDQSKFKQSELGTDTTKSVVRFDSLEGTSSEVFDSKHNRELVETVGRLRDLASRIKQNHESQESPKAPETSEKIESPSQVEDLEMSDDEARRRLAEMDAPLTTDKSSVLSDEAATLLMLESMDSESPQHHQASPSEEKKRVTREIPESVNPSEQTKQVRDASQKYVDEKSYNHTSEADSAEEKQLGEDPVSQKSESEEKTEIISEVEEFSSNNFASDPEMVGDFLTNSDELMATLDEKILELEQNPNNRETIEEIFRAAHTLKGAAGMFGFNAIERVMHRMESLFDKVRKGSLRPDSNVIDVVFQGLDVLKSLLAAVRSGTPSGIKIVPVIRGLELAIQGKQAKDSANIITNTSNVPDDQNLNLKTESTDSDTKVAEIGGAQVDAVGPEYAANDIEKKRDLSQSTIRVDLERLDALVNLVGELVIDRTRFASIEEAIRTTQPQLPITTNMSETVQLFGRHMNEIHDIIMKIRMVPIGNAFNKFPRMVRDLARQLDKEIEIEIEGEHTELDKTLVEQIGDPLIHLIRNACDHGIETHEIRRSKGKNPAGKISLSARQEGNHIIITIEDDGKGLDVERIRRKGIERGLIAEDTALERRDIFNLIFEPGFSTAEKVTTLSGRGVGMDVVRRQISKLKGVIDLNSESGKGTVITIRLPLTLAIVQSLLVEASGELFAIPLSTVIESVRITPKEIQKIGETEVIRRHGKVLPLLHINETLDLNRKDDVAWYSEWRSADAIERQAALARSVKRRERLYVVIVGSGERRFGIVVDQLLHQQEMVIKSLGPLMRHIPCVAGGAVLGNGEVVLVLDIQELEMYFKTKNRSILKVA